MIGKADISVDSLGDPFHPPDSSVVFLDQHQASSSTKNSSLTSASGQAYDSSNSPSKRKKRSEGGRHGLMHRCAQDFWIPLTSATSHSVL